VPPITSKAVTTPSTVPGPPASPTAPTRKANCTPPYVVDANGKLLWKEECLSTAKPSPRDDRSTSERR
jgi:hypothetical protein